MYGVDEEKKIKSTSTLMTKVDDTPSKFLIPDSK
jgi:hypothetical protein